MSGKEVRWDVVLALACALIAGRRRARRPPPAPAPVPLSKALDMLQSGAASSARVTSGEHRAGARSRRLRAEAQHAPARRPAAARRWRRHGRAACRSASPLPSGRRRPPRLHPAHESDGGMDISGFVQTWAPLALLAGPGGHVGPRAPRGDRRRASSGRCARSSRTRPSRTSRGIDEIRNEVVGDRRRPAATGALSDASGRRHAARDHPARAPGHREDPAGAGRGRRGGRPLLQRLRLGVRGDRTPVSGHGGCARCSTPPARRLRRSSTSTRSTPWAGAAPGHASSGEREQTLDQLLAEMDGFPQRPRPAGRGAGLDQPHRRSRPGPGPRRPLRPPDRRRAPGRAARRAILDVHMRGRPLGAGHQLGRRGLVHGGHGGRGPGRPVQRGLLRGRPRRASRLPVDARTSAGPSCAWPPARSAAGAMLSDEERLVVGLPRDGPRDGGAHVAPLRPGGARHRDPAGRGARRHDLAPHRGPLPRDAPGVRRAPGMLMAGRAAEELVFGEFTSGAADDLRRAATLARRMAGDLVMAAETTTASLASELPEPPTARAPSAPRPPRASCCSRPSSRPRRSCGPTGTCSTPAWSGCRRPRSWSATSWGDLRPAARGPAPGAAAGGTSARRLGQELLGHRLGHVDGLGEEPVLAHPIGHRRPSAGSRPRWVSSGGERRSAVSRTCSSTVSRRGPCSASSRCAARRVWSVAAQSCPAQPAQECPHQLGLCPGHVVAGHDHQLVVAGHAVLVEPEGLDGEPLALELDALDVPVGADDAR